MQKIVVLILGFLFFGSVGHAQGSGDSKIYIKVGEARVKKSLLALPAIQFAGTPTPGSQAQQVGADIYDTLKNDLQASSYFQLADPKGFLEDTSKTGLKPFPNDPRGFKFQSWQATATDFLVRTGYSIVGDTVTLEGYIYHVPRQQLVLGRQYRGTLKTTRRIAHTFANDILEALTGKKGMFLSKIAVVSDRGEGNFKEVYVMDWDAHKDSVKQMSTHRSITLSPTWSPDGQKIAYTAFVLHKKSGRRNPDLFMYDLVEKKRWLVSYESGMNSGAHFSKNGNSIYLTMSPNDKDPKIYEINLKGEMLRLVTKTNKGVLDVEPDLSPDGKKLAFSSTKHGNPKIFIQNVDGSGKPKPLTNAGKYNATPVWSPDGSKIAFAGRNERGTFDIYVINPDGSGLQKLTDATKVSGRAADNEDPTWSPDGRHIMFVSNRTGKKQLFIISPDGSNERRITFDSHNYIKPEWSPTFE